MNTTDTLPKVAGPSGGDAGTDYRLRALSPTGMLQTAAAGTVIYAHPRWEQMTGLTLGAPLTATLSGLDPAERAGLLAERNTLSEFAYDPVAAEGRAAPAPPASDAAVSWASPPPAEAEYPPSRFAGVAPQPGGAGLFR